MALGTDSGCNMDVCMSDRLVPSRKTCGTVGQLKMENDENWTPTNEYHDVLSQNILDKESLLDFKVLTFQNRPTKAASAPNELKVLYTANRDAVVRAKPTRVISQSAFKVLDAPGLVDDFYSHPIDWSQRDSLAVALGNMVYVFDVGSGQASPLLTLAEGTVTSLRWAGEGLHLSVGTSTGSTQLWDGTTQKQLRNLNGHAGRVGALAWHDHILSSGAADAEIHHHDVRVRDHLVATLAGAHTDLVCGLDYSSGGILASGGNDNKLCIWENTASQAPLNVLDGHDSAVKALKWCPFQRHVLASGGGSADRRLCLWNASSGRLLMAADAESQVTGIVWGHQEKELMTSHGYSRNQLSLWKYPSLAKSVDLEGHTGRILGLAQSPNSSVICSSSADETLRFWNVFTANEKKAPEQFAANPTLKTIR